MTSSFKNTIIDDTGFIRVASGTSAQRTSSTTTIIRWTNTGSQSFSVLTGTTPTLTNTSWTAPTGVTRIEVLVVAGGGGGGNATGTNWGSGGGGGAGGLIYNSAFSVTPGTSYTVTVGAGGAGATQGSTGNGTSGSNSVFSTLTAIGGGFGGSANNNASSGGSGGGTGYALGTPGTGTSGQGYAGANNGGTTGSSGGGGGAGGAGINGGGQALGPFIQGRGGDGLAFDISGTMTYYAGGGGGGYYNQGGTIGGQGGLGGGGAGGAGSTSVSNAGADATASTGGGGGGGSGNSANGIGSAGKGGNGGSGVVIIRYTLTSASEDIIGQTRQNTTTNNIETFNTANKFAPHSIGEDIITSGMLMYLDGGKGVSGSTWTDQSGNGNDGTLVGSPTFSSSDGGYYIGDGTAKYVTTTVGTNLTAGFTIECAFYGTNSSTVTFIASMFISSDTNTVWRMERNSGGSTAMDFGHNGGTMTVFTSNNFPNNQWNYVTLVWDGTYKYIYKNGRIEGRTPTSQTFLHYAGATVRIGARQDGDPRYWEGRIGFFRMYNRALNTAEIAQNYNAQAYRYSLPKVENSSVRADGSSPANAGTSAKAIKDLTGTTTSGMYWIKNSTMAHPVQVYCDMSFNEGGWMLLAYGFVGNTGDTVANFAIPNMNHDADAWAYTPLSRASSNGLVTPIAGQRTAVLLTRASTETLYAAGNNPATGGINEYAYVYKFTIPNPSAVTYANHSVDYTGSMNAETVTVTGLKGDTGTWTRYTLRESLGATWSDSYPTGYGATNGTNPKGFNSDFGPFFPSIHPRNAGYVSRPDVGCTGFNTGNITYTYRGWYGASIGVNQTGQTSIWVR